MGRTNSILKCFPHFYNSEECDNLFHKLINVFGQTLDSVESDLIKVMRAHWVDSADNEGSKGFNTAQKGDLDKIFSLYLENLGGTSQLKQIDRPEGEKGLEHDAIYRDRIKGLINVLKSGASTKEGIIAIVAANLGIVGDDPVAVNARNKIRIIEFMPELIKTIYQRTLFEEFIVVNPNVIDIKPEIRVHIRSDFEAPLIKPGIVNIATDGYVRYNGTVKTKDVLSLFPDGTALLNGIEVPVAENKFFLPPGESRLRLEAFVGYARGEFNRSLFDYSAFEQETLRTIGFFDQSPGFYNEEFAINAVFAFIEPVADIDVTVQKLHPASFTVIVPWDIPAGFKITEQTLEGLKSEEVPDDVLEQLENIKNKIYLEEKLFLEDLIANIGAAKTGNYQSVIFKYATLPSFTEKLDELPDKPRNQIKYIIDKVKAAGVFAAISYEKQFKEIHNQADKFYGHAYRRPLEEDNTLVEANFDIGSMQFPYPNGIEHGLSDNFVTSGMFDYTQFDSLNTFA